jgi:hypothetical protein
LFSFLLLKPAAQKLPFGLVDSDKPQMFAPGIISNGLDNRDMTILLPMMNFFTPCNTGGEVF